MTHWRTRGKRGDALEDIILYSNDYYLKQGIARIDKAATPIKVVDIDDKGFITRGFFEKKATVDFYGVAQGIYLSFDAKETNQNSFPIKNIHAHQVDYMTQVNAMGGLSFLIIQFKRDDAFFLLPVEILLEYYLAAQRGGRKSIPRSAMIDSLRIRRRANGLLHYLEAVNRYLDWREQQSRT